MSEETVGVQACRPEDRAMPATPAGAELVAKAAAALDAYRCIAPLCQPLGCSGCNCAVPADVYAVLMRAERADLHDMVRWAYSKLHHASYSKQEDALMLDRMKLLLEHEA